MKEKAFAASVKRENIMECEDIGLSLEEFITIALEAMQAIPDYNEFNK
jgi:predicted hydrolase (HD superfamily)